MRQITLSLRDETVTSLQKDFAAFIRTSLQLDPTFIAPSFEDFLRAKLLDNIGPLTEHAVQHMLQNGHYAWAKRTLDKEFPDVVSLLMRHACAHGFNLTISAKYTADELMHACREWAKTIVNEANGDKSLIEPLAAQFKAATLDIQTLEEKMQTPAWRVADSIREKVYEAKIACEIHAGSHAREKLGELRALLELGLAYGSLHTEEAQHILAWMQRVKPELFVDEPNDIFARIAAWLRHCFTLRVQPSAAAPHQR